MAKIRPLKFRIWSALAEAKNNTLSYHDLMDAVFPDVTYPKAKNYSSNGGPPGCAMVFGRVLRQMRKSGDISWYENTVRLSKGGRLEPEQENWNDKPCSMKVNLPSRAHETYPANYAHTAASLLLAQLPEKPQ